MNIRSVKTEKERVNNMKTKRQKAWDVFLYGCKIDRVFYLPEVTKEEVLKGLIEHDGYNGDIKIKEG